ncbi:MAG: calcium-binding protein [Rhodobacteraceae bacterium]|nr:calcium-binding protein [Paracoccaceae bacterium]
MATKLQTAAAAALIGAVTLGVALPVLANQSGHGGQGMMQGMMRGGAFGMMGLDFATLDADGDGKVTQAELLAHRKAEIEGVDADGDGLISEAELAAHITARMQTMAAEMASMRIKMLDADGDGKVSVAEMQVPPMAGQMLSRLDTDGDGALSEAEMTQMQGRMGARMGEHGGRGHGMKGGHPWFGWGAN